MYETDLLMCIAFILLFMYISDAIRDYMKYRRQFWNIRGPKTLPLTIIAYIFTARSNAGKLMNFLSLLIFFTFFVSSLKSLEC